MHEPSTQDRNRPVVVGLGELLWDCFGDLRRPGGAPANVAFHADQLGARGVIGSRVGRDEPGDALVRYLRERDLDVTCIQRDPHHPTGSVTVETDARGEPHYVIHENVAWDHLTFDDHLARVASQASAVAKDAQGNVITGRTVTWSGGGLLASISSSGLVSGLLAGLVPVTGTVDGVSGSASLTITALIAPPPPTSTTVELPRTYLNYTFPAKTGQTIVVPAGGNLQTALNNAQRGDEKAERWDH